MRGSQDVRYLRPLIDELFARAAKRVSALLDYPQLPGTGVNAFTGSGTIAEIVPTETKLAWGTSYEVDSFAGQTTTNDPASFTTIATIAVPTVGVIDGSVSVAGHDSGDMSTSQGVYRSDLTFTAVWDGAAVVLMVPSAPTNPLNVRTNGLGSGYGSQLLVLGRNVLVQVVGQGIAPPAPVKWSVIGQIQTRS